MTRNKRLLSHIFEMVIPQQFESFKQYLFGTIPAKFFLKETISCLVANLVRDQEFLVIFVSHEIPWNLISISIFTSCKCMCVYIYIYICIVYIQHFVGNSFDKAIGQRGLFRPGWWWKAFLRRVQGRGLFSKSLRFFEEEYGKSQWSQWMRYVETYNHWSWEDVYFCNANVLYFVSQHQAAVQSIGRDLGGTGYP